MTSPTNPGHCTCVVGGWWSVVPPPPCPVHSVSCWQPVPLHISDWDIERIAQRVAELLKVSKP